LNFRLYPLRFGFAARDTIFFPPGKSSNLLRGAFGTIFRKMACAPECPGARECDAREACPYARMFEPSALDGGPSGLVDWPRPFVFRATRLDGRTVKAGTPFSFDLNLFDMRSPVVTYLVLTFAQLAREGLGPGRGRADLTGVWRLGEQDELVTQVFDGERFLLQEGPAPMEIRLAAEEPVARVKVRFVTPTELKSAQEVSSRPEFHILAGRIRDRLSTLRACYDEGPLDLDFRGFGERAARVRMTRCEIGRVGVERRSSRTGQSHSIGGFVGEAEYVGELGEFMPYLKAARWAGVGRQTVWGKGEIAVQPASA
jgi:hypothetical protein